MRVSTVLLVCAALLVFSTFAFAYSTHDPIMVRYSGTTASSIQKWVGKPATQLMSALGHPSYTMTGTGGRTIYDYVEQFRLAGPTVTYQFTVGPNGKVKSATLTL